MQTLVADVDNDTLELVTSCSVGNSTSGSAAETKLWSHDVTTLLWAVGGPTLLVVGVVGNVLILVTMTRRRMRGTSTCVYLSAMAVLDLMVLAAGLTPNWLDGASYLTVKELSPAACKMEKFFDYTTGDSAVWCRVMFTLDRLVAVLVPLYVGRACGYPTSTRLYVVAACVAAVAKNAHVIVTRGAEYTSRPDCSNGTLHYHTVLDDVCGYPNDQYRNFEVYVRPWLAFTLVSAVPFVVIAVCNSLIIAALVVQRRKLKLIRSSVQTPSSHNDKHFVQLAVMCVAASGLFLLCSLPSILLLIGKPNWNVPKGKNPAYQVSKAVSNLLFYVTFSANFFLYCLSGDRFRSTLRAVLLRCFCCEADVDRRSHLVMSMKSYRSQTQQHRVSSQRSTLTSSLACATATVLPSTAMDAQRRPAESDASPVTLTVQDSEPSLAATDHLPADRRIADLVCDGVDDNADIRPENAVPVEGGPADGQGDEGEKSQVRVTGP